MVFGTFDVLHPGHIDMFRQARKYGNYLVVVVARDETVEKLKKYTPRNNFDIRIHSVEKNPFVDYAKPGYLDDQYRVITEETPRVICLGYDQSFYAEDLKEYIANNKLPINVVRLEAFNPGVYKSSKL